MIDPVILSGGVFIIIVSGYHGIIRPINRKRRKHHPSKSFAKIIIKPTKIELKGDSK